MGKIDKWLYIGVRTTEKWADKVKPYVGMALVFPFVVVATSFMAPFILIGFCVDMKERRRNGR